MKKLFSRTRIALFALVAVMMLCLSGMALLSNVTPAAAQTGTYTVNYYNNDGSQPIRSESVDPNEDYTLYVSSSPEEELGLDLQEGDYIPDWTKYKNGRLPAYNNGTITANSVAAGETINLYAYRRPYQYHVKFYADKEAATPLYEQTVVIGQNCPFPTAEEVGVTVPTGNIFYWTNITGSDMYWGGESYNLGIAQVVTRNYYACVEAAYTVSYSDSSNTILDTVTVTYGEDFKIALASELGITIPAGYMISWSETNNSSYALFYYDGETIEGGFFSSPEGAYEKTLFYKLITHQQAVDSISNSIQTQINVLKQNTESRDYINYLLRDMRKVEYILAEINDASTATVSDSSKAALEELTDQAGKLIWDIVMDEVEELNNATDILTENGYTSTESFAEGIETIITRLATLDSYVTDSELTEILNSYITSAALTEILSGYVTEAVLDEILNDYVTGTALETALAEYVSDSDLTAILDQYATITYVDGKITSAIEAAKTELGQAIDKVAQDLQSARTELDAAIAGKASTAEVQAALDKLEQEYKAADAMIEADISSLETLAAGLEAKIDELNSAYKAADNAIWAAINKLQSDYEDLENRVEQLEQGDGQTTDGEANSSLVITAGIAGVAVLLSIAGICIALGLKRNY